MKRTLLLALLLLAVGVTTSQARRLKVFSCTKTVAAGQLSVILFENPTYDEVKSISKCTADKLRAWTEAELPIIRVEQGGKQIWTTLGSYQTLGDSVIATFMAPVTLVPGEATLFLVNGRDASVPYKFTVAAQHTVTLKGVEGNTISPLEDFRLYGEGFLPGDVVGQAGVLAELEHNVSLSKLSKAEQYITFNKRIATEWDKQESANFLYLEQGGKTWRLFVNQCSLTKTALAFDFTAPPDVKPGAATLTMVLKLEGKEVARSAPLSITVR